MSAEAWRKQAQCKGQDPNRFFDDSAANLLEVRKTCLGCPVFEECRDWGIDCIDEMPFGIVAGLTSSQRNNARKSGTRPDWRKDFVPKKRPQRKTNRLTPSLSSVPGPSKPKQIKSRLTPLQKAVVEKMVTTGSAVLTKAEREAVRISQRDVPECPNCHTKKDLYRYGFYANGDRKYHHLPCGLNIREVS